MGMSFDSITPLYRSYPSAGSAASAPALGSFVAPLPKIFVEWRERVPLSCAPGRQYTVHGYNLFPVAAVAKFLFEELSLYFGSMSFMDLLFLPVAR